MLITYLINTVILLAVFALGIIIGKAWGRKQAREEAFKWNFSDTLKQ